MRVGFMLMCFNEGCLKYIYLRLTGLDLAVDIFDVLIQGDNTISTDNKAETRSIRHAYKKYGNLVWTYVYTFVFVSSLTTIYGNVPQRLCHLCARNDVCVFRYFWDTIVL